MLGSTAPKALSSERWLMPSGHCRATVGCLVSANQRHCNYHARDAVDLVATAVNAVE